jgi:hypothetical protein
VGWLEDARPGALAGAFSTCSSVPGESLTEPTSQLAYLLDRGVPALAHDISRPEPASQGNAVGVPVEHDDLLRTETSGGNDAAETHRAITNDGGNVAWAHIRPQCGVMASAHNIGEGQERRHEGMVRADQKLY